MARLFFASLITFGILVGMVIGYVLAAMVYLGEVNCSRNRADGHHQSHDLADQPVALGSHAPLVQ
jgi:xanthine/uracil permease